MEESFQLPVVFQGQTVIMNGTLKLIGYSFRFIFTIDGSEIHFEQDNNGEFRAIMHNETTLKKEFDVSFLKSIAKALHTSFG